MSNVTGVLRGEVQDAGGSVVHTLSQPSASTNVVIGDTGGTSRQLAYTLRVWDADAPDIVTTRTLDIDVSPGIPLANDQSVQTVTTTPLPITLSGTDPNAHPGELSFAIRNEPVAGSLSGDPPNLTYTARIGFIGEDSFSFRVNDGRYDLSLIHI